MNVAFSKVGGLIALALVASLARAQVKSGTEIRLVLLRELNSGSSFPKTEVPFLVSDDVYVDGQLVIREGTLAVGVVKQARREGAFSAMIWDKPARLAVELDRTYDVDGRPVLLRAKMNGKDPKLYHFNRANTKIPKLEDKEAVRILNTPQRRRALELLVDTLKGSRSIADIKTNAEKNVIMEVARALRLGSTVDLLLNNRIMDLVSFGAALSSPLGLSTLLATRAAVGTVQTTFRAAKEVARIATRFPGFLSRKFGGRNISAPIGLEIAAFAE